MGPAAPPRAALATGCQSAEAMTAIHQLLPVFSPGDAIGQAAHRMRSAFREAGFASEIFAEEIHQQLLKEARPAGDLGGRVGARDVVVYHLSIGARRRRSSPASAADG